jgi:transcriptional regulator with XRE-family HTH domain/DNA-directed RNA polymerase subunit RPC12/RpoP
MYNIYPEGQQRRDSTAGSWYFSSISATLESRKEVPDMDQIKIGKFIASCRKEQGMTQAVLAEKLGISDRAVSKWETGKSMPDSGIMLELCGLLKINVNELLSGERLMDGSYDRRAEENLLAMKREVEEKNRQMLRAEYWIAFPAVIAGLVMVFVASFIDMPTWLRIVLIAFALVMIIVVAFIAVGIEQKAGYYECQNCHHRYVPTYWQTNLAPHKGRTRYMKCPACGKRSWQKKVLTKDD